MTAARNAQDNTNNETHICREFAEGLGAVIGVPYAVYAANKLQSADLTSVPFVGQALAASLPLGLYQATIPVLIVGTFANYFANYGAAIDAIVDGIKTRPRECSVDDIVKWVGSFKSKNVGHVTGMTLGTGLAISYICFNVSNPSNYFSLTFAAADGTPNPLLQIIAIPYIAGAFSNLFSYAFHGARNTVVGIKQACISGFSFFSNLSRRNSAVNVAAQNNDHEMVERNNRTMDLSV